MHDRGMSFCGYMMQYHVQIQYLDSIPIPREPMYYYKWLLHYYRSSVVLMKALNKKWSTLSNSQNTLSKLTSAISKLSREVLAIIIIQRPHCNVYSNTVV